MKIEAKTDEVQLTLTDKILEIATHKQNRWTSFWDLEKEIEMLDKYALTGIIADEDCFILVMCQYPGTYRLAKLTQHEGKAELHSMGISSETLKDIESTGIINKGHSGVAVRKATPL